MWGTKRKGKRARLRFLTFNVPEKEKKRRAQDQLDGRSFGGGGRGRECMDHL